MRTNHAQYALNSFFFKNQNKQVKRCRNHRSRKTSCLQSHHHFFLLFHGFLASHESRLAVSKPGRSQKCALGARNFSEFGGENHHYARAAYSAKYLLLFRRAATNLQVDVWKPYQGHHSGAAGSPYRNADDGSRPHLYDATKRADVSTRREHCKNLLPSVLLHGHASLTPPRLLRFRCLIFAAPAPTCNVFS